MSLNGWSGFEGGETGDVVNGMLRDLPNLLDLSRTVYLYSLRLVNGLEGSRSELKDTSTKQRSVNSKE